MSLPAWQSKTDSINCWSLLAHIWRQEEMDMGLPREDKGTLVGTTLPLMGATQNAQGMLPLPTRHYTAAIEDVRENVRAKIYAMCTRIGFSHPSDGINTEDKITLCIVENYLDFKTGEVWYEVGSELAQEGLCPTSPDQECLQEIIHCSEERAEEVTRQHIDDTHEAKERQVTAIDASRPSAISLGERFHTTNQSSLNVTTFCSRNITIATSPMKILSENKIGTASQVAPATTS
ncbi:PREDICTED: cilia- and flagella-associated protein 69-like isoform X1 [Amphimedon queenslandica]|uniref:Cilia- and flagella-associated protein 69 ARM repeats domain-containing protein n=1 Tax=Amphimedon queenslandica TaxID=400682 RepID=A0AAN0JX54_AMPQE|nr:PREDICTED: cilia- and flagella-associated protein 69-like isoform X1 [Amphimedon queenslandica]|eukprot:XP_019861484.1 PREDICTED: cilia- and flagella-associated protein 69-like isoform X1 [Amphimedon queenslandica]